MVMADRSIVLCEPLCFIVNKFSKLQLNVLKAAIADFYAIDAVADAKQRLLDDVSKLTTLVNLPHIPKRRDGGNRLAKEVDDIVSIITIVDEQGLLNNLPRYAVDNPDNMPSLRLFDGDMLLLLSRLDKLETKLSEFGSALDAITAELHNGQVSTTTTTTTTASAPSVPTCAPVTFLPLSTSNNAVNHAVNHELTNFTTGIPSRVKYSYRHSCLVRRTLTCLISSQ